ncbi:MAG TPA: HWE histidine kinase domain-containing protein [Pseudomonas sp.]|jgi:light-regulated signal transduction histidine kinase (bacteriophytochrome)|uniref:HWE histidine kinase domain-containing protein n=1 Tax=Pseudomonas sp. TaxID=306 RepID=UPI002EDADA39
MNDYTQDASLDAALEPALEAALADCATEPIRIPGAIQPHGVLLTLSGKPLRIEQVSTNCAKVLGVDARELLGKSMSMLMSPQQADQIERACSNSGSCLGDSDPIRLSFGESDYSASLHCSEDVWIIELEPFVESTQEHSRAIARVLRNLQAVDTLEALFDVSVREIQALTGYDRVMIYRFEPEGHGKVVAEALTGSLPSYHGLNFPGSDIPAQARELYRLNWIRVIPDATYTPVPLVPLLRPATGQPLDLGFSTLRSVSPVHCEYLKNMGVVSSMSISLLDNGKLWGLITCAHPEPLFVPRELRDACTLIGQLLSVKIASIIATKIQREWEEKVVLLGVLASAMSRADREVLEGLVSRPEQLQALTQAAGAAVLIEDRLHLFGNCPTPEQVRELYLWIRDVGLPQKKSNERAFGFQGLGVFHTHSMYLENPSSAAFRDVASGVIAFILPKSIDNVVMWFRPQLTSTMNWSGNPTQHLSPGPVGSASHRLHPRQSFDIWQEQVIGKAQPWSMGDLYAAEDIRRSALEHDLQHQVHREPAQSSSAALERQRLDDRIARVALLNELNHRVKNTLATVQAMAALTASSSDSLASFRKSFDARLFALSQAHDALAQAEWTSSQLADLILQLQATGSGTNQITFKGDQVTLEPRTSLALSMVFHELLANALQHGALMSPSGRVTITATLNPAENPQALKIDWVETGGPPVTESAVKGFGFRLMRRSIEGELRGKAQVHFPSSGLHYSMLISRLETPAGAA